MSATPSVPSVPSVRTTGSAEPTAPAGLATPVHPGGAARVRTAGAGRAVAVAVTLAAVAAGVWERPRLLIGFAICAMVFVPLEHLVPLVRRPPPRQDWLVDVVHSVANRLPITVGVAGTISVLAPVLHAAVPAGFRNLVLSQPGWLQFIVLVLIADLANYSAHRALHEIPLLWRLHEVHHSSTNLDWLSTSRGHPLDQIINLVITVLPIYAIGFDVTFSAAFLLFQFYFPFLAHANTRITLRPLSAVMVTPAFHHWHHAAEPEAVNRNYGALLSVWDRMFRTAYLPRQTPTRYGTGRELPPTWTAQLAAPFRGSEDTTAGR